MTLANAQDPTLADFGHDVWWIVVIKILGAFVFGFLMTLLGVWFERRVVGRMAQRPGPNRHGPFGLLQTLADGTKLFFKEDSLPDRADRLVFRFAPFLAFVPAFLLWSVVPLGGDFTGDNDGTVEWFGHVTRIQLADPPIGILLVLALSSISVYGVMLAGWSSGSKYPLLGSVRASAQMISYEAALGLSLAAVLLIAGTLSTSGIVDVQDGPGNWNIVTTGFIPFVIFMIAMTAELNRPPFDLVEAEQELVGGFNTEYSSIRFALFFLAEFMNVITMSAIIVTLFLGGPQPLWINEGSWLADRVPDFLVGLDIFGWAGPFAGTLWVILKVLTFLYVYVWFRATLPRLRYDQLMDFGWKLLIPVGLGWLLVLTAIQLGNDEDWNVFAVVIACLAALGVAYLLFGLALTVSRRNREREGAAY